MADNINDKGQGPTASEHEPAKIAGSSTRSASSEQAGYEIDYPTIAGAVGGKGWSTLIDLAALTGRPGAKLIMEPIRIDDLEPANLNG